MLLFSIMKRLALLPFLLAAVSVSLYAQQSSITPESLKVWLTYLSSDELEGRATFSEGLGLAAAYIADQLKQAGVKPGGDHGSYFQRVEVMGIKSTNHSFVTVEVNGQKRTFNDGEGIRFPSNVGGKRTVAVSQVEFVGYGLDMDADHNDYKGLNVKDKAVVFLGTRGPKGLEQQVGRLLRARPSFAAEEMGAAATIAPPPEAAGGQRDGTPNPPAQTRGRGSPQPDFTTSQRLDSPVTPAATATDDFLEFLFSGSDVKYAELKAMADQQQDLPKFALNGVTLTFNIDADYQTVVTRYTRNVVGIIEGTDPKLKDTYVAFGAHYDHLGYNQGILPNGETDRINNCADDDGSGTTALIGLEIGRAHV